MSAFFYPDVDPKTVKNLLILRQLVAEHPAYFLEAPYPQSVEADIQKLLKYTQKEVSVVAASPSAAEVDIEQELRTLYKSLQTAKPNLNDPDQMGYYRTAVALLEKLLGMQSTARNIKTMGEHHALVLNFIEEICSPTQRDEFIKRLRDIQ